MQSSQQNMYSINPIEPGGGCGTPPPEHIYPAVRSYGAANTLALIDFS